MGWKLIFFYQCYRTLLLRINKGISTKIDLGSIIHIFKTRSRYKASRPLLVSLSIFVDWPRKSLFCTTFYPGTIFFDNIGPPFKEGQYAHQLFTNILHPNWNVKLRYIRMFSSNHASLMVIFFSRCHCFCFHHLTVIVNCQFFFLKLWYNYFSKNI